MATIGYVLYYALNIYFFLLFIRALLSWIPFLARDFHPHGILLAIMELLYTITDPPLKLLNRFIPPLRLGGVALDLGFMVLLVIILVLQRVVVAVFF